MKRALRIISIVVALTLVACNGGRKSDAPPAPTVTQVQQAILTTSVTPSQANPQAASLVVPSPPRPASCSEEFVTRRIIAFVDAFNHGDQQQLATFFSRGLDQFDGFSEGFTPSNFTGFHSDDIDSVLAYFIAQHQQHYEQWQIARVDSPYYENSSRYREISHLGFSITWSAKDISPEINGELSGRADGKGALNCADGTIRTWAMGVSVSYP
ncbi:MAG: hypothetical protein ACR2JW_12870 [Thermomicrobiales bacterium]